MNIDRLRALALSLLIAAGCGYDPKVRSTEPAATPVDASPDVATTAHDGKQSEGETGLAGATGTGTSGFGGATGSGGGVTLETGGTPSSGGTPAGGATSETGGATGTASGGSIVRLDASPDLPLDVPATANCPPLKAPSHGSVKVPSYSPSSQATYTCDPGYTPSLGSRTCQGNGTWTDTDPVCNQIDCGTPPVIPHSKNVTTSTAYNGTATYTCDSGYTSSVSKVITCQDNGHWSATTLVCNPVDCGAPPVVANADALAPLTTFGSIVQYSCKTGFALTGTNTFITCQASGTWTLPAPVCHVVDCGPPPPLEHGTVSAPKTGYNDVASYTCSEGFALSGLDMRACQATETWYGTAPTCLPITPKLTINKAGSGLGTVTSPASTAISCGTTCTATFAYKDSVTISATADPGQTFVGWDSAACKGKQPCTIQLTKDTTVNAIFSPPPNTMFVTSTTYTANLGGLAGADAKCAERASAAGLVGNFKAWLSTSTVDAKDRLGAASGWVRTDGKPVFSLVGDTSENKILYPPDRDESGQRVGIFSVITGTAGGGLKLAGSSITTCGDWTSTVDETPKVFGFGNAHSGSSYFTSYSVDSCTSEGRLYCFGTDRTAFVAPDPTTPGPRAFTTTAAWRPGAGLASADALCQSEASEAGLTGTFRALLAPTGASAASRFTGTETWHRMDGLAIAETPALFFSSQYSDVAPGLNAKGQFFQGSHWTGGMDMLTAGTDDINCKNWTSSLASDTGRIGYNDNTFRSLFFGSSTGLYACDSQGMNLVCLQTP